MAQYRLKAKLVAIYISSYYLSFNTRVTVTSVSDAVEYFPSCYEGHCDQCVRCSRVFFPHAAGKAATTSQ